MRPALHTHSLPLIMLAAALTMAACQETENTPDAAFGAPIDFAFACEGQGRTFQPTVTDDADDQALCDDPADDLVRAHLLGLVLNRDPAQVHVLQLNNDRREDNVSLGTGIIDADRFKPGFNGIPVGASPLRLIRGPDWGAFYVISAGEAQVERLVIEGADATSGVSYSKTSWALPGIPSQALLVGDQLLITGADTPVLWRYDLSTGGLNPERTDISLPSIAAGLHAFGEDVMLTWSDRPVLSTMTIDDLTAVDETMLWRQTGLAPACSDTLDLDHKSPNCSSSDDTTEQGPLSDWPEADLQAIAGYPSSISACEDGLDNDRDGLTDSHDPACADGGDGELLTACADGLDNNGDGLTDLDDSSCYGPSDLSEATERAYGPFSVTTVDAGAAGQFAYILDRSRDVLLVFERIDEAWVEVDVPGLEATVPELNYTDFETGQAESLDAIVRSALPGPALQGERGIHLLGAQGLSLSASRLRGELWSRIISTGSVSLDETTWTPTGCAVDSPQGSCDQPDGDDESWVVFMPTMDGKVLLIESVRRGVPMHRVAQQQTAPETRDHGVGTPVLSFDGTLTSAATSLPEGFAVFGPNTEEEVVEMVSGESPARYRAFGIWPPNNPQQTPNEVWTLSYEGAVPETSGARGRFVSSDTFYAPSVGFCTAGVRVATDDHAADVLSIDVHQMQVPESLQLDVTLSTPGGVECPLVLSEHLTIDFPIMEVGETSLVVDTAAAQVRPFRPELGEVEADETQLNLVNECQRAHERMDMASFSRTLQVTPDMLPRTMMFSVRSQDSWLIEGTRSGFVHTNRWDETSGQCSQLVEDLPIGRATERDPSLVDSYSACPPLNSDLSSDSPLVADTTRGFENWSFGVDLFPGCWLEEDASISHAPSRRGTTWSFTIVGASTPRTLSARSLESASGSLLHAQPLVPLETLRWQALLDTAGRRVTLTTVNASSQSTIAAFD